MTVAHLAPINVAQSANAVTIHNFTAGIRIYDAAVAAVCRISARKKCFALNGK